MKLFGERPPCFQTTPLSAAEQSFQAGVFRATELGVSTTGTPAEGMACAALKSPHSLLDKIPTVNSQADPLPVLWTQPLGGRRAGVGNVQVGRVGGGTGLTQLLVGGRATQQNTLAPAEKELERVKPCPGPSGGSC